MTDIERVSPTPATGEWQLIVRQSEALSQSDIIPAAYRRKPANVLVAALTGRHFGWDVLTAMRNGHVIEGTWGMKPEAMLGLVRQAGHSVTSSMSPEGATVTGRRVDNGDEMTVTFTIEDARRAGLANKGTWKSYPAMMCYWRATGMLCRLLFSDLTAGVHSTEELGGAVDADGEMIVGEIEPLAPLPLSDDALAAFRKACVDNEVNEDEVMARAFTYGVPDPLTDAHLPAMRNAFKAVVAVQQESSEVVDAEVIEAEQLSLPDDGRPATRSQVGKIKGEYHRLGFNDRAEQLEMTGELVKRPLESHNELTWLEASRVIEELSSLVPAAE